MRTGNESGFSMVAVMVGIAVALILLGAAMPVWHTVVQRDREEELIFRGEQFVDAIIRFYGKQNRYPLSLEELEDIDGQRFVRKLWKDPMMEDGRWILIFASHNGPPKITSEMGGAAGANALSMGGQRGGGAAGGLGGEGPGLTAPAGGNDPFGGGRSGNDPFAGGGGGGGGLGGGGNLGGGRGTSPPDGGGNFPGGGFEGGGSLQGPGTGGLDTPGGQTFGQPHGTSDSGLNSAPAWSSPGATFLHGTSASSDFGQSTPFGQSDNRQTHQSGGGFSGGSGGFSGGGGGGGFSGGGGGFSGGGGDPFGGGGMSSGRGSGMGGSGYNRDGSSLDDIFGDSGDLFGNRDDVMLNPFEALQGTQEDILLNARPIIGVRSRNPDNSIREYNGQKSYDQWVFKVEQMPERRTGGAGRGGTGRNATRMSGDAPANTGGATRIPGGGAAGKGGKDDSRKEDKGNVPGKGGGRNAGGGHQLPGGGGGKPGGGGSGGGGGGGGFGGGNTFGGGG